MPEQPARRAVPPFDRIIHIGAPKCGSTTLQALWHANRAELERAGVHYVGNRTHWAAPAKAVAGVKQRISGVVPPLSNWEALTKEVRATTERLALISSEWYASATKEAVHRIVRDLERERLHAVLVVRPIAKTLPSAWQQRLKFGYRHSFSHWLGRLLVDTQPPGHSAQNLHGRFWRKHRYDQIAMRWVDALGPDRVTVIVADEQNRPFVVDSFSSILGIEPAKMTALPPKTNPSLSQFEAEVLLKVNQRYVELGGTQNEYKKLVWRTFDGFVNHLQAASSERTRIPEESVKDVERMSLQIENGLRESGVRIIGNLGLFSEKISNQTSESSATEKEQHAGKVHSAANMIIATMITSGILQPKEPVPGFSINLTLFRYQLAAMVRRGLYTFQIARKKMRKHQSR
jgi:hypothetical protein